MLLSLIALSTLIAASDGPERVAVLPVLLGPHEKAQVRPIFDAVERGAAMRTGLRMMSIDDFYFHGGQELASRALACGSDAGCMANELAPFGARFGLVVVVNAELSPPLVSLMLLDGSQKAMAAQWAGQVKGGPPAVQQAISEQTAAFMKGQGFLQSGLLQVQVKPDNATVLVEGQSGPDLGTALSFTLLPGTYTVRGEAEGHSPASTQATILPGALTEASLSLEPESSIWSSPWLWVGVGAVVLSAAATGAVLAASGSGSTCICVQTRDQPDCSMCP